MAYELYHHYLRFDIDSTKIVGLELLLDDQSTNGSFSQQMAYRIIGAYLIRAGSVSKGLTLLKSAADYFERSEDYLLSSEIYNDIGHGLTIDYELDEAKRAYETSISLGKHSSDPTSIFNALLGLGKAELIEGDTLSALDHLTSYRVQSLKLKKYEAASDATSIIANLYFERGEHGKGLALMKEAVDLSLRSNSMIHYSHAFTNLAIYYFESDQIDSSMFYFHKSLDIRQELGNVKAIIESYFNLGDFYRYTDNLDSAKSYYNKSYELAELKSFLPDEIDAASTMLTCMNSSDRNYMLWKSREDSLKNLAQSKTGLNDSIINYALSLNYDTPIKSPNNKNYSTIYIILISVIFAGGILVFLKSAN